MTPPAGVISFTSSRQFFVSGFTPGPNRGSSNGRTTVSGAVNQGSNPCPRTNSSWGVRLVVRTLASHAGNTGSIPVRPTNNRSLRLRGGLLSFVGLAVLACLSSTGCSEELVPQGQAAARYALPSVGSSGWEGAGDTVAVVNGHAISGTDLAIQVTGANAADHSSILQELVTGEVLAQHGASLPAVSQSRELHTAWRRALARAYLEERFDKELSASDIPVTALTKVYKRVRVRYYHEPVHTVGHLHFVCCRPASEDCGSAAAVECYSSAFEKINDVYRQSKNALADILGDAASMEVGMKMLAVELNGQFPRLAYEKFMFFYDESTPHLEQTGRYPLVDEAFARAVVPAPVGTLVPPVKTEFGWHVVAKFAIRPRRKSTLADAEVIEELRENLFPGFKSNKFKQWIEKAAKKRQVTLDLEKLNILDSHWGAATEQ